YGDLPGIIAHAEEIKGKAGQSLRDHLDEVERNRRMNAAVLDLDLPADPEQFELRRGDAVALNAVFDELAFGPTIRRDVPAELLARLAAADPNPRRTAAAPALSPPADPEQFELRRGDAVALTAVSDELAFGPTTRRDVPAELLAGDPDQPLEPQRVLPELQRP